MTENQESELLHWKHAHGMGSNMIIRTPDLDENLDRRLHRKVVTESKQILGSSPGIVYLEGIPLSTGPDFRPFQTPFKRAAIEEAVYENPNLIFASLGHISPLGTINKTSSDGSTFFDQREYHGLLSEVSYVVINKFHRWRRLRFRQLITAFWKR